MDEFPTESEAPTTRDEWFLIGVTLLGVVALTIIALLLLRT